MAALQSLIETTLEGLGYELVELEFGGRGLLRVYIDFLDWQAHQGKFIAIEDCEKATRQLSHVLTVEDVDYARLEVSSPGVDRPLNKPADFKRFEGEQVTVKLKKLFANRRHFEGALIVEDDGTYSVIFDVIPKQTDAKKGARVKPKKAPEKSADEQSGKPSESVEPKTMKLNFTFEEADRVRLVPQISFKQTAQPEGTTT